MFKLDPRHPSLDAPRKPAWWLLYTTGGLLVGTMAMVEQSVAAGPARTALECGVIVVACGLMLFWRHFNRARWI